MSEYYETHKDIINQFQLLEKKYEEFMKKCKIGQKLSIKMLLGEQYELLRNELMNLYFSFISNSNSSNIHMLVNTEIDIKCFDLLCERANIVLRNPIDPKQMGRNIQMVIENLYTTVLEELKQIFSFYKEVYLNSLDITPENTEQAQKNFSKYMPLFIANVLNFMGEIKRYKLILYKKFEPFQEYLNINGSIERDSRDSRDCIKFYNFALANNPNHYKVYKNLSYVYREFLNEPTYSIFFLIRYLCFLIDFANSQEKPEKNAEISRTLESINREFENIRVIQNKKEYIVHENIDDTTYLRYDIEYLFDLFYRVVGILYWKVDIDKIEGLEKGLDLIMKRYLRHLPQVIDIYKKKHEINDIYDVNDDWAKLLMSSIFILHYCIDNYSPNNSNKNEKLNNIINNYPSNVEKIKVKNDNLLLNFGLYNHNILEKIKDEEGNIPPIIKKALNLVIMITGNVINNLSSENYILCERFLLILFYWFSLNYDLYNLIINDEEKTILKDLNLYMRNNQDISQFMLPQTKITLDFVLSKINNYYTPIETYFIGFLPINRFFDLNPKSKGIYGIRENKEKYIMNKLTLIHFLDLFGLTAPKTVSKEMKERFAKVKQAEINIEHIEESKNMLIKVNEIQKQLTENTDSLDNTADGGKIVNIPNTTKAKHLVVLDASNIAMRHGNGSYSTKGIQIAIDFFTKMGHEVISFLPDYLFKEKNPNSKTAINKPKPDNIKYLQDLKEKGLAVMSPPQDYDDSYCISYAKTHDAFIVTNDMFRDYLDKFTDRKQKETEKIWIKEKSISYTFNKDEFLPNPDASFWRIYEFKKYFES